MIGLLARIAEYHATKKGIGRGRAFKKWKRYQKGNGISYLPLSGASRFNLQPMRAMISSQRQGSERYQHDGEEWLYVLTGRVLLHVGDRDYPLNPGDAAHFDSRQPHRLDAMDGRDAEVILVACPIPTTLISRREAGRPMAAGILG